METVVNLKENKIQWKVNGTLQATGIAPKKGDQYVPYIEIDNKGDSIEWLGCHYV